MFTLPVVNSARRRQRRRNPYKKHDVAKPLLDHSELPDYLGEMGVVWLTKIVINYLKNQENARWDEKKLFSADIKKNKWDIQNCTNYRGFKMMSHTMNL